MSKYIYTIIIVFLCLACDVVPLDEVYETIPTKDTTTVVIDTIGGGISVPSSSKRKVLLEYYTGHLCGNCPSSGSGTIKQLKALYGNELIVFAIHAGFFAKNNANGKSFFTDFRTTTGNELDSKFGVTITGTPKGVVNRTEYNNSAIQTPTSWGSAISDVIGKTTNNSLLINTKLQDSTLTANVKYSLEQNSDLSFYITEDSIVDWQRDYKSTPSDLENYVHLDVLREKIPASSFSIVSVNETEIIYTLTNFKNIENSHLIALVTNSKNEIIQCEKVRVR